MFIIAVHAWAVLDDVLVIARNGVVPFGTESPAVHELAEGGELGGQAVFVDEHVGDARPLVLAENQQLAGQAVGGQEPVDCPLQRFCALLCGEGSEGSEGSVGRGVVSVVSAVSGFLGFRCGVVGAVSAVSVFLGFRCGVVSAVSAVSAFVGSLLLGE